MKKIFIVAMLLGGIVFSLQGQDLLKNARNGILNPVKATNPNLIFQELENRRDASNESPVSVQVFELQETTPRREFSEYVSDAVILKLDENQLSQLRTDKPEFVKFQLPITSDKSILLELMQVKPLSPNFKVFTSSQKEFTADDFDAVFYRGIVQNDPNSLVAVSIFEDEIRGMIADDDGNYVLGQWEESGLDNTFVFFNDKNFVKERYFDCAIEEDETEEGEVTEEQAGQRGDANEDCIGIFIECDNDLYQQEGSNTNNMLAYATALINEVGILYENEAVPISLSAVFVWDEEDPFADENNTSDLLKEYRQYHNSFLNLFGKEFQDLAPEADLAHLLTSRSMGGRAYIDELCSNRPYAVSGSINDPIIAFPNYSWEVMVFAHEMGHNLGSRHTHDCEWNGNDTQIDDCGSIGGDPQDCYNAATPIVPAAGGTIMSYCHLNAVGINFNLGFGPQPGNLIRATHGSSNCIGPCWLTDCPVFLNISNTTSPGPINGSITLSASNELTASNTIGSSANVTYTGGESVVLQPGFDALANCIFVATIDDCGNLIVPSMNDQDQEDIDDYNDKTTSDLDLTHHLNIFPNPSSSEVNFEFKLKDARRVQLDLMSVTGEHIWNIFPDRYLTEGTYREFLEPGVLQRGIYFVSLRVGKDAPITRKLVIQ